MSAGLAGCWYDLSGFDALPPDSGAGEIVASDRQGVTSLAASDVDLYWTTSGAGSGAIETCPIESCTKPASVAQGGHPVALAWVDRLLWGEDASYGVLDSDGNLDRCEAFGAVPWVASGGATGFYAHEGDIVIIQTWPCTSTTHVKTAHAAVAAASGKALAWITTGGEVRFCGNPCSGTGTVVAPDESPVAIAMDASAVYWTTADGRIRRIDHDGKSVTSATPSDVATGLPSPAALAPDASGPMLYFTARGTAGAGYLDGIVGKIAKVPAPGDQPTVIADGQARPEALVVTAKYVFWADTYDATIRKAAK
ncbi:MAG: hypothetical protein QM820_27110 [Minicystis sp.]